VVRTSLADPHPHNNCHFGATGVGRKEVEEEGRKKKKKNWVWARREYTVLGAVLRCLGCQPFFRPQNTFGVAWIHRFGVCGLRGLLEML
jgi:hypothetical protein